MPQYLEVHHTFTWEIQIKKDMISLTCDKELSVFCSCNEGQLLIRYKGQFLTVKSTVGSPVEVNDSISTWLYMKNNCPSVSRQQPAAVCHTWPSGSLISQLLFLGPSTCIMSQINRAIMRSNNMFCLFFYQMQCILHNASRYFLPKLTANYRCGFCGCVFMLACTKTEKYIIVMSLCVSAKLDHIISNAHYGKAFQMKINNKALMQVSGPVTCTLLQSC